MQLFKKSPEVLTFPDLLCDVYFTPQYCVDTAFNQAGHHPHPSCSHAFLQAAAARWLGKLLLVAAGDGVCV